MAKTITTDMRTHLAKALTTLAQAWRITRRDGEVFRFTTASRDITIDAGDGTGPQVYHATVGYKRSNVQTDSDFNVANTEHEILFNDSFIPQRDMRRGLFDYADVRLFFFNYENVGNGTVKQFRGHFGSVTITDRGFGKVELRDLLEVYTHEVGELYSKDCRADLGDKRCRLQLYPPLLLRGASTLATATADSNDGDFESTQTYRRVFTNPPVGYLTDLTADLVNLGFETGDTTGWTVVSGTWAAVASFGTLAAPHDGAFFLRMTEATASTREIRQDLELRSSLGGSLDDATLAAGQYRIAISCWRANSAADADTGRVTIEALDSANAVIGTIADTGSESISPSATWVLKTIGGTVPAGTAKLRVRLRATRVSGTPCDAAFDTITVSATDLSAVVPHEATEDIMYRVVTAGTPAAVQPVYDTTPGNQTTDGTLVVEAEEAWTRSFTVDSVTDQRRIFRVVELTPNTGGPRGGFPNDWFNGGVVIFETGDNAGVAVEVRDFIADDGITIIQTIELFDDMPFDIQVGDKGRIQAGCDHVFATCRDKFANWLNFVGEPFAPTNDILGQYPDAH